MTEKGPTLVGRYVLPPEEIERLSLQRVEAALGASHRWPGPERLVIQRMVYAAGDPTIADLVRLHPRAVAAGLAALRSGQAIVVDVRMVEVALNRVFAARLGCAIHCAIDLPSTVAEARRQRLPRSVVAMRALARHAQDGVVVIGNAPTALLSLLDLVDAEQVRPALIIGTPVGFVAAAESKAELATRTLPFITVEGTRGGSALAAAATNALLQLAVADGIGRPSSS